MSKFSEWLGGKKPSTTISKTEDKIKTAVSNPLSNYLASNIGKGLPTYEESTGRPLTEEFDRGAYNTYQEFLSVNPDEYFNKAVYDPAIKKYKEDILPELREGYAGNLRGSGRFFDEEQSMNQFAEDLATQRYNANLTTTQAQLTAAQSYKQMMDASYKAEYDAWLTSLPENNPILTSALQFLGVSSGVDFVGSSLPGRSGLGDAVISLVGGFLGGGNTNEGQNTASSSKSTSSAKDKVKAGGE